MHNQNERRQTDERYRREILFGIVGQLRKKTGVDRVVVYDEEYAVVQRNRRSMESRAVFARYSGPFIISLIFDSDQSIRAQATFESNWLALPVPRSWRGAVRSKEYTMSKMRVLTPVVAFKDNMEDATPLKVDGLASNKVRVGLLDNTKPNTGRLLGYVGHILLDRGLVASTFVIDKKDSHANHSSASATPAVFKKLSERADFVITGLGN